MFGSCDGCFGGFLPFSVEKQAGKRSTTKSTKKKHSTISRKLSDQNPLRKNSSLTVPFFQKSTQAKFYLDCSLLSEVGKTSLQQMPAAKGLLSGVCPPWCVCSPPPHTGNHERITETTRNTGCKTESKPLANTISNPAFRGTTTPRKPENHEMKF